MSIFDKFAIRDDGFRLSLESLLCPSKVPDVIAVQDEIKPMNYDDLAISLIQQLDNIADTIGANVTIVFSAECPGCGKEHDIDYELIKFDPSYHYCGGSPRCCP